MGIDCSTTCYECVKMIMEMGSMDKMPGGRVIRRVVGRLVL